MRRDRKQVRKTFPLPSGRCFREKSGPHLEHPRRADEPQRTRAKGRQSLGPLSLFRSVRAVTPSSFAACVLFWSVRSKAA